MRFVTVGGVRLSAIGLGAWQFGEQGWNYGKDYTDRDPTARQYPNANCHLYANTDQYQHRYAHRDQHTKQHAHQHANTHTYSHTH